MDGWGFDLLICQTHLGLNFVIEFDLCPSVLDV